jgi:hypothetical protein
MQNQKARVITVLGGMLRDQLRWQFKIKIGGSHRREFQVSSRKFQAVVQ